MTCPVPTVARVEAVPVAGHDSMLLDLGGAHDRDLHHRVALIGFDDFPPADVLEPDVTVLRQDVLDRTMSPTGPDTARSGAIRQTVRS